MPLVQPIAFLDPLVMEANAFAAEAHRKQRRKYTGEPYITHPRAVARTVAEFDSKPETLAAALLHDVVEDTKVTIDDVARRFGNEVARLVWGLTNQAKPSDGNRAQRAKINRDWLALGCERVHTIKVADIIHNLPSIVECDPYFARVYVPEKAQTLAVLTRAHRVLYERATSLLHTHAQRCGIAL